MWKWVIHRTLFIFYGILGIVYGKSLMHKIRIKSETSDQNMNDDEHIHRAMLWAMCVCYVWAMCVLCLCSVPACVYMCVLMLGIGEAIIIISIIQCVHVIENTLAVGTIAFLLDWHRLFASTVNCKKKTTFSWGKRIQTEFHATCFHTDKKTMYREKKNRQQHNKLKTKQSNRINVTQNIYVASFLLN